jgi:hypothetical protein
LTGRARAHFFFVDARTGDSLGQFTIPRPQTNVENCTTHNYNVVPLRDRYVMVSGNYQSGISVIDFTDPTNAKEIAYADPAPLVDPNPPVGIELGGDWSTYWYNGLIYESDITRGLIIWRLSDRAVAGARKLDHLNPQTQEFNIDQPYHERPARRRRPPARAASVLTTGATGSGSSSGALLQPAFAASLQSINE